MTNFSTRLKKQFPVSGFGRGTRGPWAALLCLCLSASLASGVQIKGFLPEFRPRLEQSAEGKALLQKVDSFLGASTRDAGLLADILQSGNIYGFFDHAQVFGVFEFLLERHPQLVKGFESIGQTVQKNEMMALRLGKREVSADRAVRNSIYSESPGEASSELRSLVLITGAHHSRELLTQNMVVKMALEYLHRALHHREEPLPLSRLTDLMFVPFVNVDGHKYISDVFNFENGLCPRIENPFFARKDTSIPKFQIAKFKRKNMNPKYCSQDASGKRVGVDLNRNYGFHWSHYEQEDQDECSEIFKGPYPFSEPETNNVRRLVEREKNFLVLALNFHTYGNLWVRPFNFSRSPKMARFGVGRHFLDFYERMEAEILELTPTAEVGNSIKTVDYLALGEASDWMLGEHGIIAYSPELGCSDSRADNFFIPTALINQALDENFRVVDRMLSKSRFHAGAFDFHMSSRGEFVLALDNSSLGKLFNGKFLLQASDSAFFEHVEQVWLEQEGFAREALRFAVAETEDASAKRSRVGETDEDHFLEVNFSKLNYLSKSRLVFQLRNGGSGLRTVHFELALVLEGIFTVQSFRFSQVFGHSPFWKYCFFGILYLNLVALLLVLLFKCLFPVDFFSQNLFKSSAKRQRKIDLGASADGKYK